jgi:hypothetical protein
MTGRPSGRTLRVWYPLPRRGVRVVDGAALEKRCAKAPRVRIPPSPPPPPQERPWVRCRLCSSLKHLGCARSGARIRLPRTAHAAEGRGTNQRLPERLSSASRRGRLVDYGAALEMRFGATRRGFESRPLRHSPAVNVPAQPGAKPSLLSFPGRARRGTSGALNLQSAPAGLNSHPRSPYSNATASSDVEDRVPRSGDSRTVSGPEGSSTKRTSSGAAERPGPSRSSRRARDRGDRRWVHGISSPRNPGIVIVAAGAP